MDFLDDHLPSFTPDQIPNTKKTDGLLDHRLLSSVVLFHKPKERAIIPKDDPRRKSLAWRLVHPDRRGKHDREYRLARKARLEAWAALLNPMVSCPVCCAVDYADCLFTSGGTCTQCGIQPEGFPMEYVDDRPGKSSFIQPAQRYSVLDRLFSNVVVYDPVFYLKEGLNNWRCVCPIIPNEHLKLIIQEILHSIGSVRGFSARCLTRTVIYNAVNRLFGSSPWKGNNHERSQHEKSNRKFLVYRERWLYIKKWMCEQSVFAIVDADEWLARYKTTEPNIFLIEKLESMMKVIQRSFKEVLYADKRDGLKRHNRPRRDVCILFLLYGLHPAFLAIYGTDFWKPPTTRKSRDDNTERFKVLLNVARRMDPLNYWPSSDLTLDDIEQTDNVSLCIDEQPIELAFLFPCQLEKEIISRKDFELF